MFGKKKKEEEQPFAQPQTQPLGLTQEEKNILISLIQSGGEIEPMERIASAFERIASAVEQKSFASTTPAPAAEKTEKEKREEKEKEEKEKKERKFRKRSKFAIFLLVIGAILFIDGLVNWSTQAGKDEAIWAGILTGIISIGLIGMKTPWFIKYPIGIPITGLLMFPALVIRAIAFVPDMLKKIPGGIGKFLSGALLTIGGILWIISIFLGKAPLGSALLLIAIMFGGWLRKKLGWFPQNVFPRAYAKKGIPWLWWFFEKKPPKSKEQEALAKKLAEAGMI